MSAGGKCLKRERKRKKKMQRETGELQSSAEEMSTQTATTFRWFFVALCAQISLFYYKYTYVYTQRHTHIYNMRNAGISYDKVEFKVYELDRRRRTATTHSQQSFSHMPHAL